MDEKLKMHSINKVDDNIRRIGELFPNCLTEVKDEDGKVYHNFYAASVEEIESRISDKLKDTFVRLNTIVKALGCQRVYSDEGDELEPWGDDDDKDKLTFPINKQLIEELQLGVSELRKIGQMEAFDLIASELMPDYDATYRIVFVLT